MRVAQHGTNPVRLTQRDQAVDRSRRHLEVIRELLDVLLNGQRDNAAHEHIDARCRPRDSSQREHGRLLRQVPASCGLERGEVGLSDLDAVTHTHRCFASLVSMNSRYVRRSSTAGFQLPGCQENRRHWRPR